MPWKKMIAGFLVAFGLLTGAGGYAQAQTPPPASTISCPGDRVVWVNTSTGVYHYQGERYFGRTKNGKFVCEKDALRQGDRATRNGQ